MPQTATPLAQILRAELRRHGPQPFARFMAQCLDHPTLGFYTQPKRVGREGDFFTSVSVGECFAELTAAHVTRVWRDLGEPCAWAIVEQGAACGLWLAGIARCLESHHPDCFAASDFVFIEPRASLRAAQSSTMSVWGDKTTWLTSPTPLQKPGLLLANELLDAFPVERLRSDGTAWRRQLVTLDGDYFTFCDGPALTHGQLPLPAPPGYATELNLALENWCHATATLFTHGEFLLFDYGRPAEDYFASHRTSGTLRGYRAHQRLDDPFAAPGETDLTTDVNFTHFTAAAQAAGWEIEPPIPQETFLTTLAAPHLHALDGRPPDAAARTWLRQFLTLTHPTHLGRSFFALTGRRSDRA